MHYDYTGYIFVPSSDSREYEEAYDWFNSNRDHANVIKVTWGDVADLERVGWLDMMRAENNSMIGHYENDWICEELVLRRVIKWMEDRSVELNELERKILVLSRTALNDGSYIYFAF